MRWLLLIVVSLLLLTLFVVSWMVSKTQFLMTLGVSLLSVLFIKTYGILKLSSKKEQDLTTDSQDILTQLPNRSFFTTQVETLLLEAQSQSKHFAFLLISLNNFKTLNNAYTREVGDQILQQIAKRLYQAIKKNDILARVSGDEFTLLLESDAERKDLKYIVQDILDKLTIPFVFNKHSISVDLSCGISLFPEDAQSIHTLFLHASIALYHAKRMKPNSFRFYTEEMNIDLLSRQRTELLLRNAMKKGEFLLFYQPKVEARTGVICGAEALLRWHNPELGWVPTSEFIPLSEENEMIIPLGRWVLQTACQQVKQWHEEGFSHLQMSINVSLNQFRKEHFVNDIADILRQLQLTENALDLEISENVLMNNKDTTQLRLKVLKTMGVSLSVDNFGTGFSALHYLRHLPINAIKIDKSYMSQITENIEEASIIKAIVVLAKSLRIMTIAEGIETEEQKEFLTQLGVDTLQGFYFSHPLTASEFSVLLKENAAKMALL